MDYGIYFFMSAYNSEKTLEYAVESILNQTYSNFDFFLLDNGSTDSTKWIIEKYASSDKRIKPLFNQANQHGVTIKTIETILESDSNNGFFSTLDADDEYAPDFLEKMLKFVTENNLDVATCGTDWIDKKTGKLIKRKIVDENIILEGQDFAERFPLYRNFMVTVWGAVYSLNTLRKCNFEWSRNVLNFNDTAFCMEAFRRAQRAGVLAASLHKYNILPKTMSNKDNPGWFQACKYLHRISREYLLDYGEINKRNEDYLCILFLILIKYILPRIENADIELKEKLKRLDLIFSDDMTQHVLKSWHEVGIYSDKEEFLHEIMDWITAQDDWEKNRDTVKRIISLMNI